MTRSNAHVTRAQALPYVAYVSAVYRPDILNELCQFFIDHNIELENLTCDTYQAPHTSTTMLNATITVTLPAGTQISWLRDQFLDFADALNLDALIEPGAPNTLVPSHAGRNRQTRTRLHRPRNQRQGGDPVRAEGQAGRPATSTRRTAPPVAPPRARAFATSTRRSRRPIPRSSASPATA